MQEPAQTINYLIAGYAVIFSILLVYSASLWMRWKNLIREKQHLEQLLQEEHK